MNWKIADKEIMVLWIIGLFLVALGFGIAAWVAPWEVEWKNPIPPGTDGSDSWLK